MRERRGGGETGRQTDRDRDREGQRDRNIVKHKQRKEWANRERIKR